MVMNVRQAFNLIALLALAGVPSSNAFGVDWVTPPGPEGWFWYRDDAESPIDTDIPTTSMRPESSTPSYSTAWIRKNLPALRELAIDSPTPENVRAYLYVQRLAMDRASEFESVAAFVTSADPYLDQVSRFPTSEGGAAIGGRQAEKGKEEVLFELGQSAGIWFFFRSDCEYCHAMVNVLLNLKRMYNFKVMPISLDGAGLDPRLGAFAVDRGQAAQLGVEVTPSMFLVRPPNLDDVVPIAQGFVSMKDMEERIVRMAYFHGWISERDYTRTRIANPMQLRQGSGVMESLDPGEIVRQLRPNTATNDSPSDTSSQPRLR